MINMRRVYTVSRDEVPTKHSRKIIEPYEFQKAAVELLGDREYRLVGDQRGCVWGDCVVGVYRNGKYSECALKDVGGSNSWRVDNNTYVMGWDSKTGELRYGLVTGKSYEGRQQCAVLRLDNGYELVATWDHKVLLKDGSWDAVEDLYVGDSVVCGTHVSQEVNIGNSFKKSGDFYNNGCFRCGSRDRLITGRGSKFRGFCMQCMYRNLRRNTVMTGRYKSKTDGHVYVTAGLMYHPFKPESEGIAEHRLMVEAQMNNMGLDDWLDVLAEGEDLWRFNFLSPTAQVYHANGVPDDNRPSNLLVRMVNTSRLWPDNAKIIEIVDGGERDVYDLTVADLHSFVAGGVVVHNCGKTVTGALLDEYTREVEGDSRSSLIVCPKNALHVWRKHLVDMGSSPDEIAVIDPTDRLPFEVALEREDQRYFVIHWDGIRFMPSLLRKRKWLNVTGDEIHRIAGRSSKRTLYFKRIPTMYKTGMSGTPIAYKIDHFWSPLHWLNKREFSSYWRYVEEFCNLVQTRSGYRVSVGPKLENIPKLRALLDGWYIRRKLRDVADEMPDRMPDITIEVDLEREQRRVYNKMENEGLVELRRYGVIDDANPYDILISKIVATVKQRLQLFAIATPEIGSKVMKGKEKDTVKLVEPSPKLDALMEWLNDGENDESVLVGTQFRPVVDLICNRLKREGISYERCVGGLTGRQREEMERRFQNGESRVFVATISSCWEAITLNRARTCIFIDEEWNPNLNDGFIGRLDRLGQKMPIQVIRIVSKDTVDDERREKIDFSAKWLYDVLDNPAYG